MPSRIELHALAHVAGEPVGLPGQHDRTAARSPAGHLGIRPGVRELQRPPGGKAGRHAPPDGGDTPVTPDAGHRPGGQPEAPADHRLASLLASSPRSTTRPGSVRLDARRRLTACRTPYASAPARPTGPPAMARPSPVSAVTWPASSLIPAPSSSMLAVTDSVWSSWRPARSTACCAPSTAACARVSSTSPRSRTSATSLLLSDSSRPIRISTNTPTQTSSAQNTAAISAASSAAFMLMPDPSVSWLLLPGLACLTGLTGLVEDGPDALGTFGDASFQTVPRRLVIPAVRHRIGSVTLRDNAAVEVVRVQVALAVADLARPRIVRVAQVCGHRAN